MTQGAPLRGRSFVAVSARDGETGHPLVAGTTVRLSFGGSDRSADTGGSGSSEGSADTGGSGDQLTVDAGCNLMTAPYVLENGRLLLGSAAATLRACEPERMAQDDWVHELLTGAPLVDLEGAELVLREESGARRELSLTDAAEGPDGSAPAGDELDLAGRWQLEGLSGGGVESSAPIGVEAALEFTDDGQLLVETGCNRGFAEVSRDGAQLSVGPVGLTRMMCDEARADFERRVLQVLDAGPLTADLDAATGRLRLTGGESALVLVRPSA